MPPENMLPFATNESSHVNDSFIINVVTAKRFILPLFRPLPAHRNMSYLLTRPSLDLGGEGVQLGEVCQLGAV